MGFNKRYFSEESIRRKAKDSIDYLDFYKYFKVDAAIIHDNFSSSIIDQIKECKPTDKDKILEILNKCK